MAYDTRETDWDKVKQHALHQGLILIRKSARRLIVARFTSEQGIYTQGKDLKYTTLYASIVFTGTHTQCQKWIADNAIPLPEDIYKEPTQ